MKRAIYLAGNFCASLEVLEGYEYEREIQSQSK